MKRKTKSTKQKKSIKQETSNSLGVNSCHNMNSNSTNTNMNSNNRENN